MSQPHAYPPRPVGPRWATRLLRWFCAPHRVEEMAGDLDELFHQRVERVGLRKARGRYVRDVLSLIRPALVKREESYCSTPTNTTMLRNYLKIAWRNLTRNKAYSVINIGGLSIGMTVAILIGLWIRDELSFNQSFQHYNRITVVKQHLTYNEQVGTQSNLPYPTGRELRAKYGRYFTRVVTATGEDSHILSVGDRRFSRVGSYMEEEAPELLSLAMLRGTRTGLTEPNSILLAKSTAEAYFGRANPVGKLLRMDNHADVKITGVYDDFPRSSEFRDVQFIAPWTLYLRNNPDLATMPDPWGWNGWYTYVQLADGVDIDKVSASIRNLVMNVAGPGARQLKPQLFLDPMRNWHLYDEFKNGVRTGGLIQYVWLFGLVGGFVLLLACINFMNLSTARSEKRAKEVGIRKAIGSVRGQLISQFLGESMLIVGIAFVLALLLVQLLLPAFNEVASKALTVPWTSPWFWLAGIIFTLLTGGLAGSYPALFLSSFRPVDVLKGAGSALRFRLGRLAVVPRRVLVVVQFTVSVTLIIGTLVVFRQIQFARNRPVGYTRSGLVMLPIINDQIHRHFDAIRAELNGTGAIVNLAETVGPVTDTWATSGDIDWPGKDPNLAADFPNKEVSYAFGRTVGWQFTQGRDFSTAFPTDSAGFILNEAAVRFMHLKNPIGQTLRWQGRSFRVIGVIKDVVMDSPYQPVRAALYRLANHWTNFVVARLNPAKPTATAMSAIEAMFKKYNPAVPFEYQFVDEAFNRKFGEEERVGKLAAFFTGLAIFISCLGLFGMASFVAEQRTKEIGIRKVLGASLFSLWRLLSRDFAGLVVIGFGIAVPIAHYLLSDWLQQYAYRVDIPWWIFAGAGLGTLSITLLTVSYQAIKAALMNPVKSLRSE